MSKTRGQGPLPGRAEQITHRHGDSGVGEDAVDLAFQVRPQPDQLGPVPYPAAQFPGGRWGDPGLGQPAHPQQIRQIGCVAFVVLQPPIREHLHPQRVRQVHGGTEFGQGVRGPVPAVAGFQHHLRRLAGSGHHFPQVLRIIRDPYRLQPFSSLGHPHQHRPASVQIETDDLPSRVGFAHRHPRGLVVKCAENRGLIVPVDRRVFASPCRCQGRALATDCGSAFIEDAAGIWGAGKVSGQGAWCRPAGLT